MARRSKEEYPYNLVKDILGDIVFQKESAPLGYQAILEDLLAALPDKERTVLQMRYLDAMTLLEIGDVYHVSAEQARRIVVSGIYQIRRSEDVFLLADGILNDRRCERAILGEIKAWRFKY